MFYDKINDDWMCIIILCLIHNILWYFLLYVKSCGHNTALLHGILVLCIKIFYLECKKRNGNVAMRYNMLIYGQLIPSIILLKGGWLFMMNTSGKFKGDALRNSL